MTCFLEGTSYEETVRTAISIEGDGDTIAAIAGGMAAAYWGIFSDIVGTGCKYFEGDGFLSQARDRFCKVFSDTLAA